MKYYILVYIYSYPEDETSEHVIGIYNEKELAFHELAKGTDRHSYEFIKLYEMEEENMNVIKKYKNHNNFILSGSEIVWHETNNLIDLNKKLNEKNNELLEKTQKLNELYKNKYEYDMKLYREKKIRHPILRKYINTKLYDYPYNKIEILEKFEKNINLEITEVDKLVNGLSSYSV